MNPLIALLAVLLALGTADAVGIVAVASWAQAMRLALGVTFLLNGAGHFTRYRHDLVRMLPAWSPKPYLLVTVAGVWQIAAGAALLYEPLARIAAASLMILLVVKFPANLKAARERFRVDAPLATPPWFRIPLQGVWMALLWWSTRVH